MKKNRLHCRGVDIDAGIIGVGGTNEMNGRRLQILVPVTTGVVETPCIASLPPDPNPPTH